MLYSQFNKEELPVDPIILGFCLFYIAMGIAAFFISLKHEESEISQFYPIPKVVSDQEQKILDQIDFLERYASHLMEVYNQGLISEERRKEEADIIMQELDRLRIEIAEAEAGENEQDTK